MLRLDYLSCLLTVASTILIGRRCWEGWVLAAVNSVLMCVIGIKTSQLGFIPANVFCIVFSAINLRNWRKAAVEPKSLAGPEMIRAAPLQTVPLQTMMSGRISHAVSFFCGGMIG